MVNDIERIAKLLEIPNLEPETSKLINQTVRDMLTDYRKQSEANQKAVERLHNFMDSDMFNEWLNGVQPEDRG